MECVKESEESEELPMKLMRLILIKDNLMSAIRKVEAARDEIKADGKMTIGLESKFSDILTELDRLQKTVKSWEENGEPVDEG